jgi:co-chaperonin GroES (HSP10)
VIAAGLGKYREDGRASRDVHAGDRVLFGKYGGSEIKSTAKIADHARGRDLGVISRAGAAAGGKKSK